MEDTFSPTEQDELVLERRLMTPFLSKKVPPIPTQEERKRYPLKHSNIISLTFFWWLNGVMAVGYKRLLTPDDLYYLEKDMSVETTYGQFEAYLDKIVEKHRAKLLKKNPNLTQEELEAMPYPKYSLVEALFYTFKYQYTLGIIFKIGSDLANVLSPLVSKHLISFVEEKTNYPNTSIGRGVGFAFGVSLMLLANGLFVNHFLHLSINAGAQCRGILTTALLKKYMKANAETRHTYTSGKVTSIMSTDLARIDLAIGFQPFAITFPIPVAVAIALLIVNIGVSALVGIAFFFIVVAAIGGSATALMKMRRGVNQYTDKRISLMREILNNMKIIKFYSWEDAYEKSVVDERTKEVSVIYKMQVIRNFLLAFAISLPSLISMISFLVMYAISTNKNPADIFPSVSLFGVLSQQTMMLPMALATGADAMIGIGRVRDYLQCGDIQEGTAEDDGVIISEEELDPSVALKVTNASFEWEFFEDEEEDDEKDQKKKKKKLKKEKKQAKTDSDISSKSSSGSEGKLEDESESKDVSPIDEEKYEKTNVFDGFRDISFEIKKKEFIIITGPIGSGKSSLLTALAGFMKKQSGSLSVNGEVLLCGLPWVQNATVRENICFGLDFDEEWYDRVVDACELRDDLKIFQGGDLTEIGERGINLSGGQKSRINLARAVYANKDIMLFDDVLSAVDARVGRQIIDKCFGTLLANKTRILATHQLSLIDRADRIIYLNGDGTIHMGTVEELTRVSEGFVKLMEFSKNAEEEEDEDDEIDKQNDNSDGRALQKNLTQLSEKVAGDENAGILVSSEERAKNAIALSVYKQYLREGQGIFGPIAGPLIFILLVLEVFLAIFNNVWLSFWITYKFPGYSDGFYIGLYVMFVILYILVLTALFIVMGYVSTTSSKRLNLKAMSRILHTPMAFLDVTPMGRILNRFTKDTDALDNETGEQLRMFLHPTALVIGIIILCIIYLPWFALALPPLGLMFLVITNFYQASSREIKRLEAVQRSLVYNNFNEMLGGIMTIKAFKAKERFYQKNITLIDRMNEAYFLVIANQRWISIYLDIVSTFLVFVVAMLAVTRQFNISAASVGLIITYVLQLGGFMSLIMRAYTQVENEMNSVERLCHYANELEQESDYRKPETKPADTWPEHGAIKFDHVSMRYREGLPLVLNGITMDIKPNEKIGICGRTGAGKSSIMTALYRLSELTEGSIEIDGVDISRLGMFELRSKLSIIPQDPVLFQGTIRKNLDPFGESDDMHLWDALRRSGLITANTLTSVKQQGKDDKNFHKFHLDQSVEDDGANFSLGERQLLALARALVRDSKILILDEATSSVDYETDAKIQYTIGHEFSGCTILCIAHRLKTILTYDRILVLEKGEIAQFDTPLTLFNQTDGIFRQMCERSDITAADFN